MTATMTDARAAEAWFQEAWDPDLSLGDWWQRPVSYTHLTLPTIYSV